MRNKKKYLPIYFELMENGFKYPIGLCRIFDTYLSTDDGIHWNEVRPDQDHLFALFYPDPHTYALLDDYFFGPRGKFTKERQTVVLLMAAMNGEL